MLQTVQTAPAFGGMEFSTFKLKPGVSDATLQAAAQQMVRGLYEGEPGFLGHSLLKGGDGHYVDVLFASSAARAAELCGKWGTGPFAPACEAYLALIEPDSVNLAFFDRLGAMGKT